MKVTREEGYKNATIVLETQVEEDTLYWALREAEREKTYYSFNKELAEEMRRKIK